MSVLNAGGRWRGGLLFDDNLGHIPARAASESSTLATVDTNTSTGKGQMGAGVALTLSRASSS